MPRVGNQMQQMGLDSRSMDRTEPVNVYGSFQQEKPLQCSGYGDHRIADPMARTGPEECMNLPKQEATDIGMVEAAKALHKVVIKKFDSTKQNWTHWKKMFELQMQGNAVPKSYWVQLVGHYLDDRSYFVYDHWTAQVTGNQQITWNDLTTMMESQYQKKKDVTLSKMELQTFRWKKDQSFLTLLSICTLCCVLLIPI